MVLYALWRLVSALLPARSDAKVTAKRIGYVISAVIYTTFAATAVSLARTKSKVPDGNSKVTDMTARLMGHAFGRGLIGVIGAIVIGVGLYRIGKGAKRDVEDELDLSSLSPERKRWTRRLGAIGEIGRGTAIALIGFFLLRAAMTFNANEATGLDGALRRLAIHSWGQLVVAVVGVGFVAYGVFCLSTFTHRRLEGAS